MNTNYKYFVDSEAKISKEQLSLTGDWRNSDADYLELMDIETASLNGGQTAPYIISITNNDFADQANVLILGANQNLVPNIANFGNTTFNPAINPPIGNYTVTITMGVGTITYPEFLYQTLTQPFKCCKMYLQSSNPQSLLYPYTLQHKDSTGRLCQDPIIPLLDPYQRLDTVIIKDECFTVDGNTMLTLSNTVSLQTVNLYIFPEEKINMRNNLIGADTKMNYEVQTIIQPKTLNINPKLKI